MTTYTIPGWLFCPKWADLQLCQLCTFKIDELLVQHLAFGSTYLLSCLFSEEKPDVSKPDPFALISECLGDVNEMFWLCHKFSLTVVQGHKPLCFWGTTGPPLSIFFFFFVAPFRGFASPPNWSQRREGKCGFRVEAAGWNRAEQVLTT